MKTINSNKVWFKTLKEARQAKSERMYTTDGIYRQKAGRHKGQYFVGSWIDFINRY